MYSRRLRLKGMPGCRGVEIGVGEGVCAASRRERRGGLIAAQQRQRRVCSSSRHIRERWRRLRRITESGPFQRRVDGSASGAPFLALH